MSTYYHSNVDNVSDTRNMRKFHNYVKFGLYGRYVVPGETKILELAGGRGGDLFKHRTVKTKYVMLVDIDQDALNEAERRYQELLKDDNDEEFKVDFLQLDVGSVGALKTLQKSAHNEQFDIISIQFAIHYFLGNEAVFNRVLKLIDEMLVSGGHVMITALDGYRLFGLLKDIDEGEVYSFSQGKKNIISLRKDYNDDEFKNVGQGVTFYIETIGEHPEFLVNFDYVIGKFEKMGYSVVEDKHFFQFLKRWNQKTKMNLSDTEKAYSVLNRLLVLKKK